MATARGSQTISPGTTMPRSRRPSGRRLPVQHLWRDIGAVGPDDRSLSVVDPHLGVKPGVRSQRLEDGAPEMGQQVDLAGRAVSEGNSHHQIVEDLYRSHDGDRIGHGNGSMVPSGSWASASSHVAASSARLDVARPTHVRVAWPGLEDRRR